MEMTDPYMSFTFEVDGIMTAQFTEVTGLEVETVIQEYREGGLNDYVHKLAGPTRYPSNVVLKRGVTDDASLWQWHQEVKRGEIKRKNVSIVLKEASGEKGMRWNLINALPVRWVGPQLQAGAAAIAVETLALVHQGIERQESTSPAVRGRGRFRK